MTINVSRGEFVRTDGKKPCSRCGRARDRGHGRYCRRCHNEYMRDWRAGLAGSGKIDVRLTPAEWAAVQAAREEAVAGRHHKKGTP